MPYPYEQQDEDEFNEELEDDGSGGYVRLAYDHVILLVDARKNMFETIDDNGGTYFEAAMKAAAQVMKTKVVASDRNRVGLTLFGTQKTSDMEENSPNVYVVLELASPSAKRIRDVEALARGEVNFETKFGSLDNNHICPLRSGLWSCQTEFMTIKHAQDFKRIFIFTNDDDPLKGNKDEQKKVHIVAKDAMETSIELQLMHMKRGGVRFDPNKFYRTIVTGDGDDYNEQSLGDGALEMSDLLETVRRKEFKKRTLGRMPMNLSEGREGMDALPTVSFDVKLYAMIHPAKKAAHITLDGRTNKPAQVIAKFMDDKTGAQLDVHEIRTYLDLCGERAYVTKDEMAALKEVSPKGLTVLGFKALDTLRADFNCRSPYFVYPDEESTKGSAKAFIALHAAMLKKQVYALARFTRSSGVAPRMVALLAQAEEIEDGMQLSPPGIHAIPLPFAEEIRESKPPEEEVKPEVSMEGILAAERLVKAIQLQGFDCRQFENPALQRHYAALEAIAVSQEDVAWDPQKHDTTRPNDQKIDETASSLMEAFKVTYGGDQEDDVPAPGAKRSGGSGADGRAAKKVKEEGDAGKIDWKNAANKGEIERFTVSTMKDYLRNQGLSHVGRKADLVARIKKSLGEET